MSFKNSHDYALLSDNEIRIQLDDNSTQYTHLQIQPGSSLQKELSDMIELDQNHYLCCE